MTSRLPAALLAPVLLVQGAGVRRRTPVLPEAAGPRSGVVPGKAPALTVAVLGESPAAGVGVATQQEALAARFAEALAGRSGREVRWRLSARTGTTAGQALVRLVPGLAGPPADVVLVVLGVNDTLRLRGRAAWRRDVTALLEELRALTAPGGVVVLAGLPDMGRFPTLPQPLRGVLGRHARALDGALEALAGPGVRHAPAPPLDGPGLFAEDGFHPSAAACRIWAGTLAGTALPLPM
ncbi:SGNH/GDSL hydrolase family protein [Geodermatophilus amargosae]|uniref:SGNH/GDSL hydrolase family protein n=1 Tax=Geodermatophilus amargosae TaxID=1296565 RepID=UPI0034DE9330